MNTHLDRPATPAVDEPAPPPAAGRPRWPRVPFLLNRTALVATTALIALQDVPKRPSGSGD